MLGRSLTFLISLFGDVYGCQVDKRWHVLNVNLARLQVPVTQPNTILDAAMEVFCRCDSSPWSVCFKRAITLDYLGRPDSISWKALKAELRLPWRRRNSAHDISYSPRPTAPPAFLTACPPDAGLAWATLQISSCESPTGLFLWLNSNWYTYLTYSQHQSTEPKVEHLLQELQKLLYLSSFILYLTFKTQQKSF